MNIFNVLNKHLVGCLMLLIATMFSACGGGGSGSTAATTTAVTGAVAKGSVIGATIDLYSVAADGYSLGARVDTGATIITDPYGVWSANVPDSVARPLIVVSHGGHYIDEYTNSRIDLTPQDQMKGILETGITAAITPFTDAMVKTITQLVKDGYGSANFSSDVAKVKIQYQNMLGFDPINTLPPAPSKVGDANITPQQKEYAAVLGGFSKIVSDMYAAAPTAKTVDIVGKLTDDLGADLKIDGIGSHNTKIQTAGLDLYTQFAAAPADFYTATKQYQQQGKNVPTAIQNLNPIINVGNFQILTDNVAPMITVNGQKAMTLNIGQTYQDAYATVTDNVDATITSLVGVSTVDTKLAGSYTVTYNHTDAAGNAATPVVRTVTVIGTVSQGRTDMSAGNATTAKANFTSAVSQNASNLEAVLGVCLATMAEVSADPALRTLLGTFTTDTGASLPTSAQVTQSLIGNAVNQTPINWAKTGKQLAATAANASLLQDPAIDAVVTGITSCINGIEAFKTAGVTPQTISRKLRNIQWDAADINALLSFSYGVRGGINWARAYNWNTDVDADGVPDTQVLNYVAADGYTYQFSTVSIDPVGVLNDPTFFTLAAGGATLLTSAVADFYSAANLQASFLADMYTAPYTRAGNTAHAFRYGTMTVIKIDNLGRALADARDAASGLSAGGYNTLGRNIKKADKTPTSGTVFGANLTALTRTVFPVFRYNVAPNVALSKQHNMPVVADTGASWNPLVKSTLLVDKTYDATMAGILGAGMTVDLFDNLQRPISSVLLKDSYGNILPAQGQPTPKMVTDGTSYKLLFSSWIAPTLDSCTLNQATGMCGVRSMLQNGATGGMIGAAMVGGTYRIGFNSGMTTVIDATTRVFTQQINWTGLPVTNGYLAGFVSDGTNDYVLFANSFGTGGTNPIYQAPIATGVFTLLINTSMQSIYAVDGGFIYGKPSWQSNQQQLVRVSTTAPVVQTAATFKVLGSGSLNYQPTIVAGKIYDINGSILNTYNLPATTAFK